MLDTENTDALAVKLVPPGPQLRQAVQWIYDRDPTLQTIEAEAGPLTVRYWPPGFISLVRIIVGQQLSLKAAQAIFSRLTTGLELTPAHMANSPIAPLKQAGLSQAKIATCQRLATAIVAGQLDVSTLGTLPDAQVVAHLTQIKGIGVWTANIYLLFCLERLSSFPASDLAVQRSYQTLKALDNRPTPQELLELTAIFEPYRGAMAHLLWHYYRFLKP